MTYMMGHTPRKKNDKKRIIENMMNTRLSLNIPQFYVFGCGSRIYLSYFDVRCIKIDLKTNREIVLDSIFKNMNVKKSEKNFKVGYH